MFITYGNDGSAARKDQVHGFIAMTIDNETAEKVHG